MEMTLKDTTRILKGQIVMGDPKSKVIRAACDSRRIKRGDLFFALKGEKVDGHDYVATACREGAGGVVVSKLQWMKRTSNLEGGIIKVVDPAKALQLLGGYLRIQFKGPVVGITGSNGKTTTKQMIQSILATDKPGLATSGNYNSQIGLPLVLSELKPEHQWMALEMGASEPGNIAALCNIAKPTVGVLTSIGPAHLATFGSMEKVAESKWELMDSLPKDGTAILPWGEKYLEPHIRSFKRKIVYFGSDPSCAVRFSSVESGEKIRFRLHIVSQSQIVTLPVPGRMNVSNALAAAAVGWVLGRSIHQIVEGLETFTPPPMRMQTNKHSSGAILINDAYNANPGSMIESLRSLVETYPEKKRILVIGSMLELGKESEKWHFTVGSELGRFALEQVFLLGKETEGIQNGAITVGAKKEKYRMVKDKADLKKHLKKFLKPDAVVLFKGSRAVALESVLEELKTN